MGIIEDYYALRRRRFMGVLLFGAILLAAYALNGWTLQPIWTVFESDEGEFVAGDPLGDWIYAVCDGEQQQITVSQNGRLGGAAALDSLRSVRFPNWCDLPTVDNPALADWQARLDRLQTLTATPGVSGNEVLEAARQMPISYLYLKPLTDWVHGDDSNAVRFLDAVADRPMRFDHPNAAVVRARRQDFSALIGAALERATSHAVAPQTLERWLAESQIASARGALTRLVRTQSLETGASAAMLEQLETVPMRERVDVYMTLEPRLAPDEQFAGLLVRQMRLLPRSDRSTAARQLLAHSGSSAVAARSLLTDFPSTFGSTSPDAQLDAFQALADRLRDEADAPRLLSAHLKDISGMQRRLAANYLLTLDRAGETAFALGVLQVFADLHPLSRPKLAYTVMLSPQFHDRAVQEACLIAIRLETRGPERSDLLNTMLQHHELDSALVSRIRAELG